MSLTIEHDQRSLIKGRGFFVNGINCRVDHFLFPPYCVLLLYRYYNGEFKTFFESE